MFEYEHLKKYTDYNGPQDPDGDICFCVKVIKDMKDVDWEDILLAGTVIHFKYTKMYHEFRIHRDNGEPAVITPSGSMQWVRYGNLFRKNGPVMMLSEEDRKRMPFDTERAVWQTPLGQCTEEDYWMKGLDNYDANP